MVRGEGIVRFWNGWCGANCVRDCECETGRAFIKKARVIVQSKGDYCPFTMVVGIERFDATGGASKARMPEMNAQRLCKDAKPTERS